MAPAEVPAPTGLINLPVRPRLFVGRTEELRRLDAAVRDAGPVVVQAVHGLGGVGKSTLVAQWAEQHRDGYTPIWWITADSPAAVDAGLVALAAALQPGIGEVLPSEALRERAVSWLASHDGWLLILDNVTDPSHITGLLSRLGRGRIVVTSRRATGWPDLITPLRLNVLALGEAVALMTAVTGRAGMNISEADAAKVCTELGCLPLAVEQAGAYLTQTGITAADYLRLLADYPARVYREGEEGRAAERTVARVWHVTLDKLADEPLPGRLLRALAWYAPDVIPRDLMSTLDEEPEVVRAVGRLAAYNMLTADPATATVTVHRLVQAVARTPDLNDPHRQPTDIAEARTAAVTALAGAWPEDWPNPTSWPACRVLLPHLDALTHHPCPHPIDDAELLRTTFLHNKAGLFLDDQGDLQQGLVYLERALADRRRVLGDDHPDTLISMNNLASAYRSAGDLDRAIPLFEQALVRGRRVLGDDHPDTLALVNNLAGAYKSAGDLGRAIPLLEQAWARCRQLLGDDHPDTLTSMSNLAGAYESAGDLGRAIPLLERALADRRRVLGDEHPDALTSMSNLAGAYRSAGDLGRAVPLLERSLADRRRVLGDDHPDALTSANNLAYTYQSAGNPGRAIPLLKQTLAGCRRVLGDDHPVTLGLVNNLAGAYRSAGDLDRAIPLLERSLADRRRVLGDDHPYTLTAVNNLAGAYQLKGDLDRAIPLFERSLADRRRVLGDDHPDTLTSANNLAYTYQSAGDLGRAIPLLEQTLDGCRQVLGDDHPDTLGSMNNLAHGYRSAGDVGRAIPLLERSLADRRRVLGDDHPDTLASVNNLAETYRSAGDLGRAIPLLEQTLDGCRRMLGNDHPLTRIVANNWENAVRR